MNRVVERILNLLAFLLTAGRPVTADEIRHTVAGYPADNDDAFHRMFERDKDLLRRLGIPLELHATDAWEVEFGYLVPAERYELADPGLTDEERAALWLAAQAVRLGGQPSGPEGMFKLGGTPLAASSEPLTADLGADPGGLAAAFAAVTERRLLLFEYRDAHRRIRPYGLVHRRGHWYLVGAPVGLDEVRAFRLDRARDIEMGAETGTFERPEGFRASSYLSEAPWEAGGEDLEATVLFDPEVAWWARRQLPSGSRVVEEAGGGLRATLNVANPEAFLGWILGFADQAEVIGPPGLRERVVGRVRGDA